MIYVKILFYIQELDTETAKLRSRTCYCPTELQLRKLKKIYEHEFITRFQRKK